MTDIVSPTKFVYIFYSNDWSSSRPPSARTSIAIQQWCMKRLKRMAREAGCGLAYQPPIVSTERDLSAHRTEYIVEAMYALLPDRSGQLLVVPRDTPSTRRPLKGGARW